VAGYVGLEKETQSRNIAAWTPVVAEVLQGFSSFEDETVSVVIGVGCIGSHANAFHLESWMNT
jgi:hypothetical protein